MQSPKILIVDDDKEISNLLVDTIKNGLAQSMVRPAFGGVEAVHIASSWRPDLILLDLGLPDISGLDVLGSIRRILPNCRVCIVSGAAELQDRVRGFEGGTDDYLTKPFAESELLGRVRALLRRGKLIDGAIFTVSDTRIDTLNRSVERAGRLITLTNREFDILVYLARRANQIVTRDELLDTILIDRECFPNTVDVHIRSLRKKYDTPFDVPHILTVYGKGYRFQS